ncbi:MAG: hypothetical protein Q9169_006851 [Polycauliona sp. 2 TL-2023]
MLRCPVVIIGAGLAGLTLGRCLKQHGIAAVVLEKASSSRRYNYGITLHPWAFRPLLNVLQMDEGLFRGKVAVDTMRHGKGEMSESVLASGIDPEVETFRCHRGRLENLLQEGQEIRWGHAVQNVTTSSQGLVVQLEDAESLHAEALIGTDGVHSQIRNSSAPEIELKVLPFVVFNGKRRLAKKEYQKFFESKFGSQTIVHSRYDDTILEVSINDYTPEHVDINYTYSRPARKDDPLHRPGRATAGATDIPEGLYSEIDDLKDLKQPFNIVFDSTKMRRDRVLHWLMRSSLVSPVVMTGLTKQGALLIGDAAHAMPILGGEGANHAIKDGVDLANHIIKHGTGNLQDFTNAKFESWKKAVEESEKTLAEMHGPPKTSL